MTSWSNLRDVDGIPIPIETGAGSLPETVDALISWYTAAASRRPDAGERSWMTEVFNLRAQLFRTFHQGSFEAAAYGQFSPETIAPPYLQNLILIAIGIEYSITPSDCRFPAIRSTVTTLVEMAGHH